MSGIGLPRPRLSSIGLSVVVALYLLFATNFAFWKLAPGLVKGSPAAIAAIVVALAGLYIAFCISLSVKYATKPLFMALIVVAATASWFMDSFGTMISVDVIESAFLTSNAEAGHLLTRGFVLHMLLFAVLPSLLVLWVRIDHKPIGAKLLTNCATIAVCLVVAGGAVFAQSGTIFWLVRQHHEWTGMLNPVTPLASAVKFAARKQSDGHIVVQSLGEDARVASNAGGKPRVTVIVVGETARAENFSLGGYARPTNPELAATDITYFTDTSSCGTITSVSVPCMFSVFGRGGYSHEKAVRTENLTDVLRHAGVRVAWWDNDMGSKGVADRLRKYKQYFTADDAEFCKKGECLDAILLRDLGGWLDAVRNDSVMVLHIEGSHGPAYADRYPDAYRRFTPDCRSAEFADCTHEEIVNAYDNTIAYTDHIIASVIQALGAHEATIDPSLIFMSDHGESLGEYGLYLHGAPYFMAPTQQTHVPYLIWLGKTAGAKIDKDCLKTVADQPQSHDNLFHTVLGLMDVSTSVYRGSLDTLASCRQHGSAESPLAYSEGDASAGSRVR